MTSVGSIVSGGFRLLLEKPLAVAMWAGINLVLGLAPLLLLGGAAGAALTGMAADPTALGAVIGPMILFYLLSVLAYVVTLCAAYRLVLRGEDDSFGGMRLGMDELRIFGIIVLMVVGGVFGYLVLMLMGMLATMIAALLSMGVPALAFALIALVYIGMIGVILFIWVRISLILPLSFARRRLVIDEAWALTKGRFWQLLGAYLVIGLACLVIYGIVYSPILGPMFQGIAAAGEDPAAIERFQAQQLEAFAARPMPMMLLLAALPAIGNAVGLALSAGAVATAARELSEQSGALTDEDVERTAGIFE